MTYTIDELKTALKNLGEQLLGEIDRRDALRNALEKIERRLRLYAAPDVAKSYIEATRKIALDALAGGAK